MLGLALQHASDLTTYGQDVILNPTYGITALAKRASIFTATDRPTGRVTAPSQRLTQKDRVSPS